MVGQRDVVWFLAGTFVTATTPTNRNCSIPGNATLFFPIANSININVPFMCGQQESLSVAQLRAASKMFIDGVNIMSVTVDSVDYKSKLQRIRSEVFAGALPLDNLFNLLCGDGIPSAGIYSPAVDEGYYLLLQPLAPGNHTIHFTVEGPMNFVQDVTYTVTVVPVILQ
jgi:hypothetical protein